MSDMRRFLPFLFLAPPLFATAPRVEFKETRFDFGVLQQGTTAHHQFTFRNTGDAPLEIQSVNTSCGCTAALASEKIVPPGGEGRIDATYDSRGKMGDVEKQIRVWTNDLQTPLVVLTVSGLITASAHPEMTGTLSLFEGSCRTCHADRAEGMAGRALFGSTCAMCHEHHREGGKFIAPLPEDMSTFSKKDLRKIISRGKPGVSMPGFSREEGGPLDKKQIKSLVDYIKGLKEK